MSSLTQSFSQASQPDLAAEIARANEGYIDAIETYITTPIKNDDVDQLRENVRLGLNISKNSSYRTFLGAAASNNAVKVIDYLVTEHDMNPSSYYYASADYENCNSALMDAVSAGHMEAAQKLISLGADINYETSYYRNALFEAAATNKPELLDLIASHGGTVPTKLGSTAAVKHGILEKAIAAHNSDHMIPHLIKKYDLDINQKYSHENSLGYTPVTWSVIEGHAKSFLTLLRTDKADLTVTDATGISIMQHIEETNHPAIKEAWEIFQDEVHQNTKSVQKTLGGHRKGVTLKRRRSSSSPRTSLANRKKFNF